MPLLHTTYYLDNLQNCNKSQKNVIKTLNIILSYIYIYQNLDISLNYSDHGTCYLNKGIN